MSVKAHPIKALLAAYDVAFQAKFSVPAPISPAKDAALAKQLLSRYSLGQLQGWLTAFFASDDPFIVQAGYTFGVFTACLGKVITAQAGRYARLEQEQGRVAAAQARMANERHRQQETFKRALAEGKSREEASRLAGYH